MGKYLELWSKNILNPFVTLPTLITTFNLYDCGFIEKILSNSINFDQIISLMLSACKVLSNIFITSDQILEFVRIFDRQRRVDLDVYFKKNKIEISSIKRSTYSLKEFIVFVKANPTFESSLIKTKVILMKEIFSEEYVRTIIIRYKFMNANKRKSITNSLDIPKESCIHRLKRLLTNEPHPYHYDYSISYNNKEENTTTKDDPIESLLLMIKQEYGYGYRNSRMKHNMTDLSSHSICHNHSCSSILNSKASDKYAHSSLKYKVANGMYQRQHNNSVSSLNQSHKVNTTE